ncbi:Glycosyltransferase [Candidatus Magnetomoraceae bacterium gMMP-15]
MKSLLINTTDISGGAARAAFRLHQGLGQIGAESSMLVQNKISDLKNIAGPTSMLEKIYAKLKPHLDRIPLYFYNNRQETPYNLQWIPDFIQPSLNKLNPDIVHLHWICGGFIKIESLARINKPIVWTLHDMWAFTGGCHYSGECHNYCQSCGQCPQLSSQNIKNISHWVWNRKQKVYNNLDLTVVTLSQWMTECVKNSSLFKNIRVKLIPNGLNLQQYKPIDKSLARELLNLPHDKKLILFGAMRATSDKRKGFQYLQPALQKLSANFMQDMEIIVFGSSKPENPPDFGFPSHYLGVFHDDISLALLYSAADVFIAPSVEDNLPNTVLESIACGTPCVAFNIGGMPDMIDHKINGYLANPFEIEDLAQGISWVLKDSERHQKLCHNARQKAEKEFSQELQAKRYLELYQEILG